MINSPSLSRYEKKFIEKFLDEYALYRQKGGLLMVDKCLMPDVINKCKQYLGYDEKADPSAFKIT